jgi:erythromycin esterase
VRGLADADDPRVALVEFARCPTWMWANEEVVAFARWLRELNLTRSGTRPVGFYGLDVYSLWDSLHLVLEYLREHLPEHLDSAVQAWNCFEPYADDPHAYARATRLVPHTGELAVVTLLSELLDRHGAQTTGSGDPRGDAAFDAEHNARAAVGAEAYYRAMIRGGPESWNVRDTHMADTLDRLLDHHREGGRADDPKAVVWEHNTHVGDARFTDMADAGMVNVGQLVRERYGEPECVLVGLRELPGDRDRRGGVGPADARDEATSGPRRQYRGAAARGAVDRLGAVRVPAGAPGLDGRGARPPRHRRGLPTEGGALGELRPHGPRQTVRRLLWLDETTALHPLHEARPHGEELETWPFGGYPRRTRACVDPPLGTGGRDGSPLQGGRDGNGEAAAGGPQERQEGAEGCAVPEDDRGPAEEHAFRAGKAGGRRRAAEADRREHAQDPAGAVRGGEAA